MKTNWIEQLGVEVISLSEAANRIKDSDQYYVYLIWKMYTPLPVPFYVGKGHWQRILKHEMESEFAVNVYKANIIKKHKRLGVECGYSIVGFFADEESAFEAEVDLIELIGRFDTKSGPLANRTSGGDGSRGHLALKRGESHSARPVIAGGQRYACLKDAAESLTVHSAAIHARIKNGVSVRRRPFFTLPDQSPRLLRNTLAGVPSCHESALMPGSGLPGSVPPIAAH